MQIDALTKRETEILAELAKGGRIPSIARDLFISLHTVRNHLRNIFSKLGVHSQAELIEYVKQNPSVLGDCPETDGDREALDRTAQQAAAADLRVAARIAQILEQSWNAKGLKEVMRVVLPLDEQSEGEWRVRLSLWGREVTDAEALRPNLERLAERRDRVTARIRGAQEEGWVRQDLGPEELGKALYSVVLGAALQLLRDNTEHSRQQQLHVIDAYVDSITGDD